jgi:DNA-binding response OmpR family regulator
MGRAIQTSDGISLNGTRVLFLEDEVLININTTELLEDMGCVVRSCFQMDEAQRLIDAELPEIAILDVNLGAHTSYELAERLERLGVPVIFLTAYGSASMRWQSKLMCRKPYSDSELRRCLITALTERNLGAHADPVSGPSPDQGVADANPPEKRP